MQRGEIWWADLPAPVGAEPGFRHPVLIVQADALTASRMATVVVVVITSNMRWATAPGNVVLHAVESNLPRDSVANVTQIVTMDKHMLDTRIGQVTERTLELVDYGLRLILDL